MTTHRPVVATDASKLLNILIDFIKQPLFHSIFFHRVDIFPLVDQLDLSVDIQVFFSDKLCILLHIVPLNIVLIWGFRRFYRAISHKMKRHLRLFRSFFQPLCFDFSYYLSLVDFKEFVNLLLLYGFFRFLFQKFHILWPVLPGKTYFIKVMV